MYIKKLDKKALNNWVSPELKALSFIELKNPTEILNFINNCTNYCEINYNKEKIEDIIYSNRYLAYIYYKNDNPLGFLISDISVKDNKKILKIENVGILNKYIEKSHELDFIKSIIFKAWEKKGIDKIIITFKSTENKMKEIMKDLEFRKEYWKRGNYVY